MSEERYSIVITGYKCPVMLEEKLKVCLSGHSCYHTEKCPYQWGDTKEQLIRKVAQVLFKKFMKTNSRFKGLKKIQVAKRLAYKLAKEIVEFLGVE